MGGCRAGEARRRTGVLSRKAEEKEQGEGREKGWTAQICIALGDARR